MLIASQNITNYDINLPDDVIFRINLAWINDLESLQKVLEEHKNHNMFIDLPKNRTKPPNNRYSMDEIKPILETYSNVKYFALSNVDSAEYLSEYLDYIPKNIVSNRSFYKVFIIKYILSYKLSIRVYVKSRSNFI